MKKRRTAQWINLIVVIIVFVLAVIDPLAIAKGAFIIKIDARAQEKATEKASEAEELQANETTTDETETNGTKPVKSVLLEKGRMDFKPTTLCILLEENKISDEVSNFESEGKKQKDVEEAKDVEEWVDMHICVDVATIYESPEGDVLEDIVFRKKVQLSSEECKAGWGKIRLNDGRVGYIKIENLMTPDQMLNNFQYLLGQILTAEAGGVGLWEMLLVGEVVVYRLVTPYWEFANYCIVLWDVVSQPGQYPDTLRKINNGLIPTELSMEAAKMILLDEHEFLLPDNCYWQTGFEPNWNVEVFRYPGEWVLDDGSVIDVVHYYSVLAD